MNNNYDHLLKQALKRKEAVKTGQNPNTIPPQPVYQTAKPQNKITQSEVVGLLKKEKKEKYSTPPQKQPQQFQTQPLQVQQEQETPPPNNQAQELASQLLNQYYQEKGEPRATSPQSSQEKPKTRVVRTKTGGFIRVPVKEQGPQTYTKGSVKKAKQKKFGGGPNPPPEIPAGRNIRELQVPEHRREMFEK